VVIVALLHDDRGDHARDDAFQRVFASGHAAVVEEVAAALPVLLLAFENDVAHD